MHRLIATLIRKLLNVITDIRKFGLIHGLTLLKLAPLTKDPRISYRVSPHHHPMGTGFIDELSGLGRFSHITVSYDWTLCFFNGLSDRRVVYFRPVKTFDGATVHGE
jgi:hypothetical protein